MKNLRPVSSLGHNTAMTANNNPQKTELVITTQTFIKTVLLIIVTIMLLNVLRLTAHAILIVFISFFLALALNAPVAFIARHMPGRVRGNRALATSLAFLIVVLLLGAFIASLVPPLVRQTQSLVDATPKLVDDIRYQQGSVGELIRHYHLEGQINTISSQLADRLKNGAGTAFTTVKGVGTSVFTVLTVLVMTFMMLAEGSKRIRFFIELVPAKRQDLVRRTTADMYKVIKGYVNGQVLLAALAALLISPVLFIFDISYPVGLIVIIFICGLIPMVGHTIGAIIVTTVALFTSPSAALIILLYYILYQQIENYLVQPHIQANTTDMSPLLVFISLIIGVSFGGILGGLVAIPIAGCLRVALLEYLRTQNLSNAPTVKAEISAATGKTK